jgi:primary-amine oxidase
MVVDHPLARLSAEEIRVARAVLDGAGLVTDATRFAVLALEEPPKQEVLAFAPGDPVNRRVRAVLLDSDTGASRTVLASITRREVEEVTEVDPAADGQPPILLEEFEAVDEIVKANAGWRAAMERRGVTDLDLVCVCPLSAGAFDIPGEEGKRMLRALSFLRHRKSDHPWAHPIDGVVAYVDLTAREVVDLVDGDIVQWAGWSLRIGFDPREGLVLYHISFRDGERDRPVVYRASVAEMVVPYAHPGPVRYWQNYFDAGEYLLGQQANSLVLGCDCLGEIHYLDAVLADNDGEPREIPNAVCLHEEDFGVGWKHTDIFTGSAETRRQRRLVISFFVTVGNYDYGFYWYLYLDGTIQLEVKATGVLFTSSYGDGDEWASEVAPGLGAPFHQHLFNARLDMMVDGLTNAVEEVDVRGHPVGPANPQGNAFGRSVARLTRESQAARSADPAVARSWQIVNPQRTNRMGRPVAYALYPQGQPTLLADERSSIARRAAFATRHLWVTRYDPAERYPAGDLVNQHPGGAGIPSWIARDRSLDGEDLVVWHTFGMTHVPRPEDWPVMPVDVSGFVLKPVGFFDRNPTLDVREP